MNHLRLLWRLYRQKQNAKKPKGQISLLQKQKLDKLLCHAYEHSPYYRKAFESAGITADNITKTPLHRFPTLNSVLNPTSGTIRADSIGTLILQKDKIDPGRTRIICRQEEPKLSPAWPPVA